MSSDSASTIASEIELVPANCFEPFDLPGIYGRVAPFEVDLGSGDGALLTALAAQNPDKDFLGIERLLGRVRSAIRKIERAGLTNARVTRFEISYAVEHLLLPHSVSAFYLLFPDPWPKRRHAARRLVSEKFLAALHRALVANGTIRIATDETEYFGQITRLVAASKHFVVVQNSAGLLPSTKFERRFLERGVPIQRLELRKVSPVT
ncbi:MAG TPA: tRNA (guanosine(46)-N7)-methyltransferase TrmB [Chthoniobacterales bacterium]|nr:tRNA (guanosine(46)-N7)-methyltransferase TrmB [Chthoniobacterales bacterium]